MRHLTQASAHCYFADTLDVKVRRRPGGACEAALGDVFNVQAISVSPWTVDANPSEGPSHQAFT